MALTTSPPSSAWTVGFWGGAGRPTGVAVVDVHGPCDDVPTAATSHSYAVPFVKPSTTAEVSSDTPSTDLRSHSPTPRQRIA